MNEWLEKLFRDIIWAALVDFYTDIASWAEDEIETKLKELSAEVGKAEPLSTSPLVRVVDYVPTADPAVDHITFLVRGRVPLFKGVESVFMRVEVTLSTRVDLVAWDPPIEIVEWHTITGDLKIGKQNVFSANLGFGYDKGSWLGRGALKIVPAGFGLDIYLGGLSDRGAMIGLSIDLPAPIPLGSTGLGLKGMGGDFAYNFIARLEEAGLPVTSPTAKHYVAWARNTEVLDRWQAGPIDETAVGVGINTDLVTLFDNGHVLALEPIGLAVLTPGPVFVLGGVGKLLSTRSTRVEGYLAVDIASASMALGLGVMVKVPAPESGDSFGAGEKYLVDASGALDAFFSFSNPSTWYINLGTDKAPIAAKIISDIVRAQLYLMLDNYRVAFGAGISIGGQWKWWIITLTARIGADVAAVIGWNPVLLEGLLRIWAELGLKIWKFGFMLRGSAEVVGHTPDPTVLDFILKYKLDLPWPIPDIKGEKKLTLGDENPSPPTIAAPLLAGHSTVDGTTAAGALEIGLLHALTGRQWAVDPNARGCWPDVEIVIPFSSRVTDQTGTVVGAAVSPATQGGYVVAHRLTELQLTDISHGAPATVPGLQAIWAAGPGGDTARLHVLGADPFSWVTPHVDVLATTTETPGRTVEQGFHHGTAETFAAERRFGEMLVAPQGGPAGLVTGFWPALPTRVLRSREFRLRFRTALDDPVDVEEVTLLLLVARGQQHELAIKPGGARSSRVMRQIYPTLHLIVVTVALSPAQDELSIASASEEPLLVFAVRYREARRTTCNWQEKVVLKPGRYQLSVAGESSAAHPGGSLPPGKTVSWSATEVIRVDYPETLRPYIHYSTIGDSRIFDVNEPPSEPPWNPTMHGFGFPIYRGYRGLVRFRVPYMDRIFPVIRFRLIYETGEQTEQDLMPAANGAGETYLPGVSQRWIRDHCGAPAPDQEVTLTSPFVKAGPAAVRLLFDHPDGQEVKLDEWTCFVSQFDSFADHLAWPRCCITVFYGPAGRAERPCCALPGATVQVMPDRRAVVGRRVDPLVIRRGVRRAWERPPWATPAWEAELPEIAVHPEELSEPPADWRLPSALTQWLAPLDAATGYRFARFAAASGARFNGGAGDILNGVNDTVDETTVEAVVDAQGRPFALWLRTPEPVDWRRVTASLRIQHVEQDGDCPTAAAARDPLDLTIEALPSPDASSAFLVGAFAGQRTRLPRGIYTLTLRFDAQIAGLPALKPTPAVGGPVEQVICTFVQPSGADWPLPASDVVIPAYVLERLIQLYHIRWPIVEELWRPRPDPRVLEELLRGAGPPPAPLPGGPDPLAALASAVARLETLHERLAALADAMPGTELAALAHEITTHAKAAGPPADEDRAPARSAGPESGGDA